MVRQWQEMFWQKHYSHVNLEQAPDFVKLAEAYDCVGLRCDKVEDVEATIVKAMEINDRPVIIDFRVAKETNVYPIIPAGQTIHEMVTTKPVDLKAEPVNACHLSPSVIAEGIALDAEGMGVTAEIENVAR
jgi:acetolactate synthase-1/2/3 large subunit